MYVIYIIVHIAYYITQISPEVKNEKRRRDDL
jgi:hypothetical protein